MPSQMPTVSIPIDFEFDKNAPKYRIGLVALDTDLTLEWDFHRVFPHEVAFYTSHIPVTNPLTPENLRKMRPNIQAVARSIVPEYPLDVMVYGCTSASIAIGYEGVKREIQAVRSGIAVVTPSSAAIKGLYALNIKKITLMTPYIDSVNQILRQFFETQGIEVLNMSSFCFETDLETVAVPPAAIQQAAIATCHEEAEAIFISCTAFRALHALENIEAALGKPALSSNQCVIWDCLQSAKYAHPILGYGRLLRA